VSPRGNLQSSNPSIGTKLAVKVVFCTIIAVIMANIFRRITVHLPCTVPCYAVQQIFFSASPRETLQPSNISIGTKLAVKVAFCTIILVIMSNLFRRITLHLPCTVPCYAVQQNFFFQTEFGKKKMQFDFLGKNFSSVKLQTV